LKPISSFNDLLEITESCDKRPISGYTDIIFPLQNLT